MNRVKLHARSLSTAVLISAACGCVPGADESQLITETEDELHTAYEVWLVDQSNSNSTFGGRIYIYAGQALSGEDPSSATPTDVIDLGLDTSALCFNETGANPVRPHMLLFNREHSHAVLSFVASGHVVIFDAWSRAPLACFRTSVGAGGARQAHAAFPSADSTYILVANQNGKLLERINTNYGTNTFTHDTAATLDLASCTTPNGFACQSADLRPDNAPICPIIDSSSSLGFVTLRGGGMFVVDPRTTPMSIVAEYDRNTVHGNGCGGLQAINAMYINSGGGTASNLTEFDVYRFPLEGYSPSNPPNTPNPLVVFSDDAAAFDRDSHGMTRPWFSPVIWVLDRAANVAELISVVSARRVATVNLTSSFSADPTPDLADVSPVGTRIFISTRGPNPLSGDPHVATGDSPGLMVIKVRDFGYAGDVKGLVRITNVDGLGVERADAHGVRVRRVF